MATPSSYVSCLRRSSSRLVFVNPIGKRNTMAVLVPKLRITFVMAPSRPAIIEPTPMMVPVPMITPSTVRKERILCSRTVASASPTAADNSTQVMISPSLFHPQGFDRIELGGALRRIDAKEKPDNNGKSEPDRDC